MVFGPKYAAPVGGNSSIAPTMKTSTYPASIAQANLKPGILSNTLARRLLQIDLGKIKPHPAVWGGVPLSASLLTRCRGTS